jgi:hypothetical protein
VPPSDCTWPGKDRKSLARLADRQWPEQWTTFNTRSVLGGALLGQQQNAAAEPLLVAGYEGLKQQAATIPAEDQTRLTEALERLVQLYDATGQQEKAANWRKKLAAAKATKELAKP